MVAQLEQVPNNSLQLLWMIFCFLIKRCIDQIYKSKVGLTIKLKVIKWILFA